MMNMGRLVSFKEAMQLANSIGIKAERTDYADNSIVLDLVDGSALHFHSEYEGPYSEVTPGEGIQPPTCYYVPGQ
jgi:hypothetical protein